MNEKKSNERGVAETLTYSAAEAPGGPSSLAGARATFASPGDAGVGSVGLRPLSEVLGHEIYCGCPGCSPASDDSCYECGQTCDAEFCFCPDGCDGCSDVDLALEQFTFTITPETLPVGDYQDCWHPDNLMAFWDEGEIIVADPRTDERWRLVSCAAQDRPASRQYYTWFCERIGVSDPCTEDYMRSISS